MKQENGLGIAWGAEGIGAEIGLKEVAVFRLLNAGQIKSARKVGGRWCAPIEGLREQFCAPTEPERAA